MRTIVIGAGDVGYDVAKMLSLQRHDVTVIDISAERITHIKETVDVMALQGSGTSARVLRDAGIRGADLLVAVTDVDEVNLLAAMLGGRAGAKTTIARVRSEDLTGPGGIVEQGELGIDLIINPEESTAREVVALLKRAVASDVVELADGRLQLVGIRIDRDAPIVGLRLDTIASRAPHLPFRVMGITRGGRTIIPRGQDSLQKDDQVFVLAHSGQMPQVVYLFGKSAVKLEHIMIVGGSRVAGRVAARLRKGHSRRGGPSIVLVEPNAAVAERLAEDLEGVLVIHGEPSDIDLLVREGLAEMDAFVSVTADEESNLVSCLLAKHLGVRKTVAMLSKGAYIPISRSIGLDAAVSQKLAVSREVARFLRGKHVTSVTTVLGLDAEIIEVRAGRGAPILKAPIGRQSLPNGVLLGSVVRGKSLEIATGATQLQPGDRVVVFALPDRVHDVEDLFRPDGLTP